MKRCELVLLLLSLITFAFPFKAKAQAEEAQQLLLNVEKLAQLKQMLSDLKKGYQILFKGYTAIKNISEGNFTLHRDFLDGLLEVSPVVRNYRNVTDIVSSQIKLVKEYKVAIRHFRESGQFTPDEMGYLQKVYTNLFDQSLKNLGALAVITKAGKLRMSDDERLEAIDAVYEDVQDQLTFLRHFNNKNKLLAIQRVKNQKDIHAVKKLYGIDQ